MFSDTLSATVLQLCDARKWSYEVASERCKLSSRYFGDIVRGKAVPSVNTLEKLCIGFQLLPDDLLIKAVVPPELLLEISLKPTEGLFRCNGHGFITYPICPWCRQIFEQEYPDFFG